MGLFLNYWKLISIVQIKRKISELFNNPKKFKSISSKEYLKEHNGKWYLAFESMNTGYCQPKSFGKIEIDFGDRIVKQFKELGVVEISEGYIYCKEGWVFSQDDYFFSDLSWYGKFYNEIKMLRYFPKPKKINGSVLSLLSDWADTNYGHLLFDSLPRINLVKKAGFKMTDFDYILCPGSQGSKFSCYFKKLGIPMEKCLWSADYEAITADQLFATSFPGERRNLPSWSAKFLQKYISSEEKMKGRRLYISRSRASRNLKNQLELIELLKEYNFEIYNPSEHSETFKDFAQASIIIGPHGAGLADIIFCQPGTKVLELIPSNHVYPYYYTAAQAAGLDYSCVIGQSEKKHKKSTLGPSPYKFYIDLKVLRMVLDKLLVD